MIIHYPVFGGPHTQAMRLARALEPHGWHTTVLLPDEAAETSEIMRGEGVDVTTTPLHRLRGTANPIEHVRSGLAFRSELHMVQRLINELKIDLIQVSGLVNLHGAIAGRRERKPVVWQLVDTRSPMLLRRLLMPVVQRHADVVMSTGMAVARVHPGFEEFRERLYVFYMPVDPERFAPDQVDRAAARRALGFDEGDLVIGTVGNLNPQKGHEFLIRATSRVRLELGNVKALIVGASYATHKAYERRLHSLITSLGLEAGREVILTGGLRDVRPALAAMDVFALSAVPHSEGTPAAVEEAMMMGRPVVATNVGAIGEVVESGITGRLVPPRDTEFLAHALIDLLRDSRLRATMGSRGRERALRRFSTQQCAAVHAAAYADALNRRCLR
jgi:glycosyltransferase involved in cell wall biosynthesis